MKKSEGRDLRKNDTKLVELHGLLREVVKAVDEWKPRKMQAGLLRSETLRFSWVAPLMLLDAITNRCPKIAANKLTQVRWRKQA